MPIRPEMKNHYPRNWPAISRHIRLVRAESRCECAGECGLHRGRRCTERNGDKAAWARGRVVLTVAHLNHRPEDVRHENLKAMCNKCHLLYDRYHHAETRAARS